MNENEISKLVLETSRELEHVLNNQLLKEYGLLHNIDPEQNRFSLKQEIIGKSAYFLTVKKKYVIHVTNEEGVDVDKLDIEGLITQRSDYPSMTKSKIMELLKMLLIDDVFDRSRIKKFVEDTESYIRDLCRKGMKEVCRPVSFSKDQESYKKAPIQIEGMLLWNKCEYNIFVPGTRGYLYKITGIDFNKAPEKVCRYQNELSQRNLKYIVMPSEEPSLPEYYNIDVDAMLKFAWTDRCTELLEPVEDKLSYSKRLENNIITF